MYAKLAVLAGLLTAAALVSGASASSAATKQKVTIDLNFHPKQTFLFVSLQGGSLKGDSGRLARIPDVRGRTVMRDGQRLTVYRTTWTLQGKRGTLTIQERSEWVDVRGDANKDGIDDGVAFGTWKLVRGTGQYAGIAGGGRSAHAGLGTDWNARYEGFLTSP